MYRCSSLVELMSWHNANKNADGLVQFVCDSKAWSHIDNTQPNFAVEPYNIRLGVALNGQNPYADLATNLSQPHFEGSVRSPLTLPKMGFESPPGLPRI
jgi:hypothetical protein